MALAILLHSCLSIVDAFGGGNRTLGDAGVCKRPWTDLEGSLGDASIQGDQGIVETVLPNSSY
jgi:hypothetical protein